MCEEIPEWHAPGKRRLWGDDVEMAEESSPTHSTLTPHPYRAVRRVSQVRGETVGRRLSARRPDSIPLSLTRRPHVTITVELKALWDLVFVADSTAH